MSAYPPALKTVLKAVPCILMCLGMSTLTWAYMHGIMRHSQDHVPKHSYRYTINKNKINPIRKIGTFQRLMEQKILATNFVKQSKHRWIKFLQIRMIYTLIDLSKFMNSHIYRI
jgi:hypothetical protein